jgi:hypothetical protein
MEDFSVFSEYNKYITWDPIPLSRYPETFLYFN